MTKRSRREIAATVAEAPAASAPSAQRPNFRTLKEFVDAQPRTVSKRAIAARLGIAVNTLSQMLAPPGSKHHRFPSRTRALRWAAQFDISLEGLLNPPSEEAA